MRCNEPGHRVAVAIGAPRRRRWVVGHHDAPIPIPRFTLARMQHEFALERVHVQARIQQSRLRRHRAHLRKDDGHSVLDG